MFHFDKSRIPPDKLDDPRLIEWERASRAAHEDKNYRMVTCVHEAGHAVYMEKAGARVVFHGPVAFYDSENDTFDIGTAAVAADGGSGLSLDALAMARWYVAGRIAQKALFGKDLVERRGLDESDAHDFKVFCGEWKRFGFPHDQMMPHWEQAKVEVEKDLRSPALRRQIWERAREFEQQLLDLNDGDLLK